MTTRESRRFLLVLAALALLVAFVYGVRAVLPPFLIGAMVAYLLDPAADRLEKYGLSRGMATSVITLIFFALIALILVLAVPLLVRQTGELLAAMPGYIERIQTFAAPYVQQWRSYLDQTGSDDTLNKAVTDAASRIVPVTGDLVTGAINTGAAFFNILSLLLITPLVTFYLIRDWDNVTARVDALLPAHIAPTVREQLSTIDDTLAGFIRGQLNVCLILGLFYGIALSLTGLQFGFVIGLMTGLLAILPYVGFLAGVITALIVGILQFGFTLPLLFVGLVYAAGQVLESYFLTPKLVGGRVGLHPLWVIFAIMAGGALFGFVGVLLAVPVAASIGVLIRFALTRYQQSTLFLGR